MLLPGELSLNGLPSRPHIPTRYRKGRDGADLMNMLAAIGLDGATSIVAADFRSEMLLVRGGPVPYLGPMTGKLTYANPTSKYRRKANGLYVKETGIIPEYDINGQNIGFHSEPQDINRLLWSSDLSNAAWSRTSMPTAPIAVLGPDGAMSAWTLTDDQSGTFSYISQSAAVTANTATHQIRFWLKKALAESTAIPGLSIYLSGGTSVSAFPRVDPYTGATAGGAVVTDEGGWWGVRCPIVNNGTNTTLTANITPAVRTTVGGADSVAAVGSNTFWNPQAGDNFVASSPIVTTTAQVTRAADVLYMLLSALPWDQDEGTLVVRARTDGPFNAAGGLTAIGVNGPSGNWTDFVDISHNYEGTTCLVGAKGGVEQFRLRDGAVSNAFVTSAGAWSPNDVAFTRNGGAVTLTDAVADTNLTVAERLYFGSRSTARHLQGHVLWAVYIPRRATNAELAAWSANT